MAPDHEHSDSCGCADGTGRRNFMAGCGAAMAFALAGTSMETAAAQTGSTSVIEDLLRDREKDWGRWGDDDELGRLNLLGSEEAFDGMKAATRRGRKGVSRFTLQLSMTGEVIDDPPTTDTGDPAFPPRTPARRDNTTPVEPEPSAGGVKFVDDKWATDFFLQGTTHLDALGHAWYGEQIYNGFSARTTEDTKEFDTPLLGTQDRDAIPDNGDPEDLEDVTETRGLGRAGVENSADNGLVGRGVLLDVGRQLDAADEKDRLPRGYGVTYDELVETADAQGTEIRERDLLLIRTGSIERTRDDEAEWAPLDEPGIVYSEDLLDFFVEKDIPYVGADNLAVEKVVQEGIEVEGYDEPQTIVIPLHGALMRDLGVYLNEILDLRELGEACAEDGIYEFLFTAAPLNVERGSGAPINPVVLKATNPGRSGEDEGDEEDDEGEEEDDENGDNGNGNGRGNDD